MTFESPEKCEPPLSPVEAGGWDLEIKLADLKKPFDFVALFGRDAPVEVEIGSGSGLFLAHEAARRPEVNFFAIEKDGKQVARAKDKWRRRELLNTRILRCDAHYFLEDYPPAESIAAYTILYSDPWFKKRHHKRRVFQPRLLAILERTLQPGGLVTIKTDITEYYEVMIELFAGAAFMELIFDKRLDLEPDPEDVPTNYQRKAIEAGRPLHYMQYRKVHSNS